MNVWPEALPPDRLSLSGTEGELMSVSIAVDPHILEKVLEALEHLPFPVNPEIHHRPAAATTVEFPAYAARLSEIERVLALRGFPPGSMRATGMLEQIRRRGYNTNW
jgi:hypothetical protein